MMRLQPQVAATPSVVAARWAATGRRCHRRAAVRPPPAPQWGASLSAFSHSRTDALPPCCASCGWPSPSPTHHPLTPAPGRRGEGGRSCRTFRGEGGGLPSEEAEAEDEEEELPGASRPDSCD